MEILFVATAAFGGGIVAAILGWLDSGEDFVGRKFASSVFRALLAGGIWAIGYSLVEEVTMKDFIIAFCAGAGIDVLGNRLAGSIRG